MVQPAGNRFQGSQDRMGTRSANAAPEEPPDSRRTAAAKPQTKPSLGRKRGRVESEAEAPAEAPVRRKSARTQAAGPAAAGAAPDEDHLRTGSGAVESHQGTPASFKARHEALQQMLGGMYFTLDVEGRGDCSVFAHVACACAPARLLLVCACPPFRS